MQQRRFIVGILILFFFTVTGGLTSCALFESASGSDLTNAVGMTEGDGPGSGKWVPPVPQNRNQCLQLHSVGITLKENLDQHISEMEPIRARCVGKNGEFLPGVNKAECTLRFNEHFEPAQRILTDLQAGDVRYTESCTSVEGGSDLPAWPQGDGEKEDEEPKPTIVPEDPKDPAPADTEPIFSCPPYCCLTCTQRLNTGYMLRPLEISPSG
jgi:hypothetical protein